ncbi:MAG: DUF3108 domain-containing protein [Candidatus Kryptonium sp.]
MKRTFLILPIALLIIFYFVARAIPKNDFKFENEYLEYHGYWGFINLGSIKVWTETNGNYIKSRFQMDSNPWLFFINIHYGFESEFRIDSLLDAKFLIYETRKGRKIVTIFERKSNKIIATQKDVQTGEIIEVSEKEERSYYNGIASFYLTRMLLGSGENLTIPILIQFNVKDVNLSFPKENASIRFLNSTVITKKVSGFIPFVAEEIAGVTGDFVAYYSDDSARIPIKGYFKTSVGNVRIELVRWERKNWHPPQIVDKK